MGDGVDVETNAVSKAAGQMDLAAAGVGKGDPHTDVGGVSKALPESTSAGSVQSLKTAWQTRFKNWKTDAENQAKELRASAATYEETDGGSRRNMNRPGMRAVE